MSGVIGTQVAWVGDNVIGHSMDGTTGQIDTTEGFGAIDSVFRGVILGPRIIDIGGGAYDANCAYAKERYFVDCAVYDPYKRDHLHNQMILDNAAARPVSATLSLSVLNVISEPSARSAHIRLCQSLLKTGGKAVFKVWPGDLSGIGRETASGYQSNRDIETYLDECKDVFGSQAVCYDMHEKTVRCTNLIVTHVLGSRSL
jgi:hypothetical protein